MILTGREVPNVRQIMNHSNDIGYVATEKQKSHNHTRFMKDVIAAQKIK